MNNFEEISFDPRLEGLDDSENLFFAYLKTLIKNNFLFNKYCRLEWACVFCFSFWIIDILI